MRPFLAIDWGTTNRRVYRVGSDGTIEETVRDNRGVANISSDAFPAELNHIRQRLGDLPAVCAGMVGANCGWVEAPYVKCPASLNALADAAIWVEPERTMILPGVLYGSENRTDVMRGEELQILGAAEAGLVPSTSIVCQPGTHCKWAWLASKRIEHFVTSMTGEIFSLLRSHSLLKPQLIGAVEVNASFKAGLTDADAGSILSRLFGVRADLVSGNTKISDASSYVSGLLIGTDVRSQVRAGDHINVLADLALGQLYIAAIEHAGGSAKLIDSHDAFVAGIKRVWTLTK